MAVSSGPRNLLRNDYNSLNFELKIQTNNAHQLLEASTVDLNMKMLLEICIIEDNFRFEVWMTIMKHQLKLSQSFIFYFLLEIYLKNDISKYQF